MRPEPARAEPAQPEAAPSEPATRVAEERAAPAPRPADPTPVRTVADVEQTVHVVQRGEHLYAIARLYGVSHRDLIAWNDLASNTIMPGQRLVVRGVAGRPAAAPSRPAPRTARARTHTVRPGEHLTRIASRYGVSVRDLMRWNGLSDGTIHPGQRLKVERPRRGAIG